MRDRDACVGGLLGGAGASISSSSVTSEMIGPPLGESPEGNRVDSFPSSNSRCR